MVPKLPLPPFTVFKLKDFHIGGSVSTILDTGAKWVNFGQQAGAAAAALRAINDGGYQGTEGEKYKELVNSSCRDILISLAMYTVR